MNSYFVGRTREIGVLKEALASKHSEMIAIIGRRRVGKTHLVRKVYGPTIDFDITGLQQSSNALQLENFANKLNEYAKPSLPIRDIRNWLEAFNLLKQHLGTKGKPRKKVIFFDELPWIAQARSGFLEALGHFWNDWAAYHNVVLVICGSAASWMVKHVIHHKGSLHNRITRIIHLQPFTLAETKEFLVHHRVDWSDYSITQLYMALGGIPHYLKEVAKGDSVAQTIDRLCFTRYGLLFDEFDKLYTSLYDHPANHIAVIRALGNKWMGMTRTELVEATKLSDGGGFTRLLDELEQSDFITSIRPFNKKKKDTLYRLTDNYSLFYLRFMEERRKSGKGSFQSLAQMGVWKQWCGYAFENVCLGHMGQIREALGISGVYTAIGGFMDRGSDERSGAQVDLLLDRADHIVNILEVKFHHDVFTITKRYAANLQAKISAVRSVLPATKSVSLAMVTTFGVQPNSYYHDLVQRDVKLAALFVPSAAP
ncbi:AAA family ATPase [Parapedobacter soli]|uniref:AAA family ATPase n=1 Tax=Parapedobacter soli TaxID=416955 RepID=UPI0021C6372F|nr:ATP-binding protein [Parapedobacter soli]